MPFIVILSAIGLMIPTVKPQAQGNIVWQTSFDCPEWKTSDGLADGTVCAAGDLIQGGGGWTTQKGNQDQITLAANNPLGTGRGLRHWRGEGSGNNGGGVRIDFPGGPKTEVWVRWYMRFSKNVPWDFLLQTKDLYINAGSAGSFTLGFHDGLTPGTFGIGYVPTSHTLYGAPGWGVAGDGNWHAYEFHMKVTAPVMAETWVDGQLVHRDSVDRKTGAPLVFGVPMQFILVGSNHCCTLSGSADFYNDYDDFAISTTGYIGPIGGSSTTSGPSAPTNLRVTS